MSALSVEALEAIFNADTLARLEGLAELAEESRLRSARFDHENAKREMTNALKNEQEKHIETKKTLQTTEEKLRQEQGQKRALQNSLEETKKDLAETEETLETTAENLENRKQDIIKLTNVLKEEGKKLADTKATLQTTEENLMNREQETIKLTSVLKEEREKLAGTKKTLETTEEKLRLEQGQKRTLENSLRKAKMELATAREEQTTLEKEKADLEADLPSRDRLRDNLNAFLQDNPDETTFFINELLPGRGKFMDGFPKRTIDNKTLLDDYSVLKSNMTVEVSRHPLTQDGRHTPKPGKKVDQRSQASASPSPGFKVKNYFSSS